MTALTDYVASLNDWMNRDFSVDRGTEFVRMAEERFSNDLRVDRMIKNATLTISSELTALPDDWRAMYSVRIVGGTPLKYRTFEDFYAYSTDPQHNDGYYYISGRDYVAGKSFDTPYSVAISYFADVPALGNSPTWLSTKYPVEFMWACMLYASVFSIEDERAVALETDLSNKIEKLNNDFLRSSISGSTVAQKISGRSFG